MSYITHQILVLLQLTKVIKSGYCYELPEIT